MKIATNYYEKLHEDHLNMKKIRDYLELTYPSYMSEREQMLRFLAGLEPKKAEEDDGYAE